MGDTGHGVIERDPRAASRTDARLLLSFLALVFRGFSIVDWPAEFEHYIMGIESSLLNC